jgi:hypothetical protein
MSDHAPGPSRQSNLINDAITRGLLGVSSILGRDQQCTIEWIDDTHKNAPQDSQPSVWLSNP